jgi:hypothetical protein
MGQPPKTNTVRKIFLEQIDSTESIFKVMLPHTAIRPMGLPSARTIIGRWTGFSSCRRQKTAGKHRPCWIAGVRWEKGIFVS